MLRFNNPPKFFFVLLMRLKALLFYCFSFLEAIVIGLFYFCWSPFFAGILLAVFKKEAVSYVFVAIATFVVYSNSAINPLVYGYLNQEFKQTYKQLFHSCRPRFLKKTTRVAPITIATKNSEKQTITAAIPVTPLEMEAQNTHHVFSFHDDT